MRMRIVTFLLIAVILLLPFTVFDSTTAAKIWYYLVLAMMSPIFLISYLGEAEATGSATSNISKLSIAFNMIMWTLLALVVVLIAIANVEILGSSSENILLQTSKEISPILKLFGKYESHYLLSVEGYNFPEKSKIMLAKNIISTFLALSTGAFLPLIFLWFYYGTSPATRAENFKARNSGKTGGAPLLFFGFLLAAYSLYSTLTGNLELSAKPPGKAPCFAILKCYSQNSFLILIAALWKIVTAYLFVLVVIVMCDEIALEYKGYDVRPAKKS